MIHRFVFPKGRIILVDWIILFLFFEQKRRRNEEEVFIEAENLSRKTKEIMIDDRNNRVSLFIEPFHAASTLLGWFDMNVKKMILTGTNISSFWIRRWRGGIAFPLYQRITSAEQKGKIRVFGGHKLKGNEDVVIMHTIFETIHACNGSSHPLLSFSLTALLPLAVVYFSRRARRYYLVPLETIPTTPILSRLADENSWIRSRRSLKDF